jgi:ectoine hydroxylase-related dioxygenase (phytanoyl-CoA dioxygenase family)
VLDDPRVARVLDALVGEDWQYWNSALSRNEGDTPWHFEAPPVEWTVYAGWFKLLFYLDPLDGGTGALRAIPGSNHWNDSYAGDVRHGLMNESGTAPIDPRAAWGVAGPEVPAVALDSRPGDAIALSYLTAHASFGGRTRRLLSLVFAPRSARSEAPRYRGLTRRDVFGEENAPFPLIATATPERRRHLERLLEHTSEDPSPLARFLAR